MSTTAPPSSPCLLVVDDDPDMLRLLSMRLTAAGYRVLAVTSAESALAQLASTTRTNFAELWVMGCRSAQVMASTLMPACPRAAPGSAS